MIRGVFLRIAFACRDSIVHSSWILLTNIDAFSVHNISFSFFHFILLLRVLYVTEMKSSRFSKSIHFFFLFFHY